MANLAKKCTDATNEANKTVVEINKLVKTWKGKKDEITKKWFDKDRSKAEDLYQKAAKDVLKLHQQYSDLNGDVSKAVKVCEGRQKEFAKRVEAIDDLIRALAEKVEGETPTLKADWEAARRKFAQESGIRNTKDGGVPLGPYGVAVGVALGTVEEAITKKAFDTAWKNYDGKFTKLAELASKEVDAARERKKKSLDTDNVYDDSKLKTAYANFWEAVKDINAAGKKFGKALR